MATFASLADVAIRLGRLDETELTEAEQAQATLLLEIATGLVTDAVGHDAAWQDALDPVPVLLRAVTLEAVARVMQNPVGARSEGETLGQYQHNISFRDGAHGLFLTDGEVMLSRGVVHGRGSGSSRPLTTLDDLIELAETGEIAGTV